jgi:alkaline phosphatase
MIYLLGLIMTLSFQVGNVTADDYDTNTIEQLEEDGEEMKRGWARRGKGNAIFIHPDGSGLNHWDAARMFWEGPDGVLEWDELPKMAVYRGHNSDQLTSTSNGGATAHAFGYKVQGPDSYGRDRGREILALSGYPGSYLREAAYHGHPVGIVNDGDIAGEPGTGAFLAETDNRNQPEAHSLQLIAGRPGFNGPRTCEGVQTMDDVDFDPTDPNADCDVTDGEPDPQVILGGGERFFLPEGITQCETQPTLNDPQLDCFVHKGAEEEGLPSRGDGRNLLQEAAADGYIVIRTRAEFDELLDKIKNARRWGSTRKYWAPKVLGLFNNDDIFNDEEEEKLIANGVIRDPGDPLPYEVADLSEDEANRKIGRLVLWGAKYNDPNNPFSFNPPTPAEMMAMALLILERKADRVRKPFAIVAEVESTDNMPNQNNAVGTLRALKRADDMIGVARDFQQKSGMFQYEGDRRTLILTAADSDGGALQVIKLRGGTIDSAFNPINCGPTPPVDQPIDNDTQNLGDTESDQKSFCEGRDDSLTVTRTAVNPQFSTSSSDSLNVQVDGIEGWNTPAFLAEPDALSAARSGGDPAFDNFDDTGLGSFGGDTETYERLPFAIAWASVEDTAGAILSRAQGLKAHLLNSRIPFRYGEPLFSARFDNTDVYRMMYLTLFGERLPTGVGQIAPDR